MSNLPIWVKQLCPIRFEATLLYRFPPPMRNTLSVRFQCLWYLTTVLLTFPRQFARCTPGSEPCSGNNRYIKVPSDCLFVIICTCLFLKLLVFFVDIECTYQKSQSLCNFKINVVIFKIHLSLKTENNLATIMIHNLF